MNPSLIERDQRVIWHPFTAQKYAPAPIPIVKGDGVYLIDTNGKKYIDTISSWWVNLHGHAHPYIAQKLYEQALTLEQVIFAGFTHEPAIRLAERILNVLQGPFAKVFYSDNGSTSTEVAIKMAIQYWWNSGNNQRTKILALNNAYHGDTFGAMSVSERSIFTRAFHDRLFEVVFIDTPSKGNINELIPDIDWSVIACFIYEPLLQGAGGMKIYEPGPLDSLLEECKKHDVLCIADEVMTGFGRTGKTFASQYCRNMPDIICLSKGLTGGTMALGVTACTEKVHAAFVDDDKLKTFFHGHSFTANPLACTAALASMDLLQKEECITAIEMIGEQHRIFLEKLKTVSFASRIKNARQLGTVIAFEWNEGENAYLNSVSAIITKKALDKGVFIRPLGNTIYLMPPYCITKDELKTVYDVIIEVLKAI